MTVNVTDDAVIHSLGYNMFTTEKVLRLTTGS